MKTCPICGARAFDDAETCFGCLHRFGDSVDEAYLPDWYPASKTQPIAKDSQVKRQGGNASSSTPCLVSRPSGNSAAGTSAAASAALMDSAKPQNRSGAQEDLFSFVFEPDGIEEASLGGLESPGGCENGLGVPNAADVSAAAIVADPKTQVPDDGEEDSWDRAVDCAAYAADRSRTFAPSNVALSFPMRGGDDAESWTVVVEWRAPFGAPEAEAPSTLAAPMASELSCGNGADGLGESGEGTFDQALSYGIVVRVRPSREAFRLRAGSVRGCHARVAEDICQEGETMVRSDESSEA